MSLLIMAFTIFQLNIVNELKDSNIPNDCKRFFIAQCMYESGYFKAKNAIDKNNYSGFKIKRNHTYVLKRFKSLDEYVLYCSDFFKRKNIKNIAQYKKYIKDGKYAERPINYLKNISIIQRKNSI